MGAQCSEVDRLWAVILKENNTGTEHIINIGSLGFLALEDTTPPHSRKSSSLVFVSASWVAPPVYGVFCGAGVWADGRPAHSAAVKRAAMQ